MRYLKNQEVEAPHGGLSALFAADGTRLDHLDGFELGLSFPNCRTSHALFLVELVPFYDGVFGGFVYQRGT